MKRTTDFIILLFSFLVVGASAGMIELPLAKVTVKVIDENGRPVAGANVALGFDQVAATGTTDTNGIFTGEGRCGAAGVGSKISKSGYYLGFAPIPTFSKLDENLNRWQPWNDTNTTILRPIVKPVALYAKKVRINVPALGVSCGYDLQVGDWVKPYGKGSNADLIFNIQQEWHGNHDYDVHGSLTFNSESDGLKEVTIPDVGKNSSFRWDRLAPEKGYESNQNVRNAWFPDGSGKKPLQSFKSRDVWEGYFFRVRTLVKDGQIISAHYGKIRGGIAVYPHNPSPIVAFEYYYNPTSLDNNLEFNVKHNLFTNLDWGQSPNEP